MAFSRASAASKKRHEIARGDDLVECDALFLSEIVSLMPRRICQRSELLHSILRQANDLPFAGEHVAPSQFSIRLADVGASRCLGFDRLNAQRRSSRPLQCVAPKLLFLHDRAPIKEMSFRPIDSLGRAYLWEFSSSPRQTQRRPVFIGELFLPKIAQATSRHILPLPSALFVRQAFANVANIPGRFVGMRAEQTLQLRVDLAMAF